MPDLTANVTTIISFLPEPDTVPVPSIPRLQIRFSGDMLIGSLNSDNAVNRGMSLFEEDSDTPIVLAFSDYDISTKTLTVTPQEPLSPGPKYTALIESKANGFLNLSGRPLRSAKNYYFYVTEWALPQPQAVSPDNGAVCQEFPLLSAYIPLFTAPTGVSTVLSFELSNSPGFDNPVIWSGTITASGNTTHTLLPNISLSTDATYYWRARLVANTIAGLWTPIQDFYYGSRLSVNQDSRREIEDNGVFGVVGAAFEYAQGNLSSWPDITITFTQDLPSTGSYSFDDSYFSIHKQPVDGGPETAVDGTWTMVNPRTIMFVPDSTIVALTRYTVKVKDTLVDVYGNRLSDGFSSYFTGSYRPLYALPVQLRAAFGSLVDDMTDDLLCFHLYRASMEANYQAKLLPMVSIDPFFFMGGPSTQQVRMDNYDFLYSVHMWVINCAMIKVLNMRLYETVPSADGRLQIGDYSQNLSSVGLLQFLQAKIKDLQKQQHQYELRFSRQATRPRSGQRASRFPPQATDCWDHGYNGRKRF